MSLVYRCLVVALIIVSCGVVDYWGTFLSLHETIEDTRFKLASRPPSGATVLVEIDSTSLAQIGVWPWPRRLHGQLLDALMQAGADEVAFDVDFSSTSNPEDDAEFAAALQRAGGYAHLAAFRQYVPASQQVVISQPIPLFAQHANPVLVNVERASTGDVIAVTGALTTGRTTLPSMASELADQPVQTTVAQVIDFSIDLNAIDRISVIDVLTGAASAGRIAGKKVVVGASAIELRDFFTVPRFGTVAGPLVQLAATETLLQGRGLLRPNVWPAMVLSGLVGLAAILVRRRNFGWFAASCLTLSLAVELLSLALLNGISVLVSTAPLHLVLFSLTAFRLIEQLQLEYRVRRQAQHQLSYIAHHDEVTGALNRYGFTSAIEARLSEPANVLLLIRLVDANTIRGALGQEVLDGVLVQAVERLRALQGIVGRIGDQSFAFFGAEPDAEAVVVRARRILETIYIVGNHATHSRVAISLANADPDWTAEQLLSAAELAILVPTAERTSASYSPQMHASMERRRKLDAEMRYAIERNQLRLAYQPQIDLNTGDLIGAEALLRWTHPDLGGVSPADFIPLAEETGYIVQIGNWVLEQACRDAANNPWIGRIGVNVSGRQFQNSDMAQQVIKTLDNFSIDPCRLEIEVTEGVLSNEESARLTLGILQKYGVGIAIDDFGTGFSSLSYLATLPFDTLKVDRSFVRDIRERSRNYMVTKCIVDLALALEKTIIAEGMESAEEAGILHGMGCHIGQGFWFGKPMEISQLAAYRAKNEVRVA